jgi:hypothetical protein
MLDIDKYNNITITQGNSAEIDITPLDEEGKPYELQEGDKVIFKVESCRKEIIRRVLTAEAWDSEQDGLIMVLNPEDTVNLPCKEYTFDCLYIFADGSAKTFIDAAMFKVVRAIAKVGDGDAGA